MRYKYKELDKPYIWERRIITKFAFLPVKINGEARWLEKVKILQQYKLNCKETPMERWVNLRFINA